MWLLETKILISNKTIWTYVYSNEIVRKWLRLSNHHNTKNRQIVSCQMMAHGFLSSTFSRLTACRQDSIYENTIPVKCLKIYEWPQNTQKFKWWYKNINNFRRINNNKINLFLMGWLFMRLSILHYKKQQIYCILPWISPANLQ